MSEHSCYQRSAAQGGPRAAVGFCLLLAAMPCWGQWPQWGGPRRDFTCEASGLAETWPADGPKKLWSREIGGGHSAIVVDGQHLYTMCRRGEQDAVLAVRAADGTTVWETKYDAPPKGDMQLEFGPGPHSTPLVVGERLFTIGGMVHFHCLDKQTGKILWSHNLMDEFGASHLNRGYGASPLAFKDTVIVVVGGTDVGVAAFRQDTGEVAWKSEKLRGGYPSPMVVRIHDEDHLLLALGTERAGLDPATGKTRWKTSVDKQLAGIMSSPVFVPPDRVFFSAAYGGGSQLFRVRFADDAYTAEELWHEPKMKVMYSDAIRIGDYIYGSSGDFGPAFLMAVSLADGKVAWRDRTFGKASLLYADGKLILLDEDGVLALVSASPEGVKIHAQAKLLEEKAFTVPTLVGTKLYLRDEHTLLALDLSQAANAGGAGS